jgi:hypothetical protein
LTATNEEISPMTHSWRWFLLAAPLVAATPALSERPADAPPVDVHFLNRKGETVEGVRCATGKVSRAEKKRVQAQLRAARKGSKKPPPAPSPPPDPGFGRGPNGEIPVAFHVVYKETKRVREGDVPLWQIEAQIDVLNAALQGTPFQFYLAVVDRTKNNNWFGNCYNLRTEYEMKQALAIDPAHVLNIYSCQPNRGILGYAYYPWSFPEDDWRHGVVALYASLPGGTAAPYNEGDTVTHEVGHYLGLYHTFEGGCEEPGDYVDDTPAESSPDYFCTQGRDSCPSTGLDPIHNFMDYSDDACIFEFTPGQADRAAAAVETFRPSL